MSLIFLGDSITQWWDKENFSKYFEKYSPINLGFAGHSTKDTLSYLTLSKLNELIPKTVVLQIGTNNADRDITTQETVDDINKILKWILEYNSECKILLIGPLPRGVSKVDRHRVFNREVNKALGKIVFNERVKYVDIGMDFLNADESISPYIFYDGLHLTRYGYMILSESILLSLDKCHDHLIH